MKFVAALGALLVAGALVLAACGDDDQPSAERGCSTGIPDSAAWEGELVAARDGTVDVDPLNDFLAEAEGPAATSPCDAARIFVRLDQLPVDEGAEFEFQTIPGDSAEAEATITLSGLADDSIRAEQWVFTFEPADDDRIEVVAARRDQSCQPGRGHSQFSAKPCV